MLAIKREEKTTMITMTLTYTMTMMWMCGMMYRAMVRYALKQR